MKTIKNFAFVLFLSIFLGSLQSCLIFETTTSRKDNGNHNGWYKNSNNPHHPNTTNPGHNKHNKKKK